MTNLEFLAKLNRDQIREGWRFTLGPVGGPGFLTFKNQLIGVIKADDGQFLVEVSFPNFDISYPGPDATWDVKAPTVVEAIQKTIDEYMANVSYPCDRCGELIAACDGAFTYDGVTPFCGSCSPEWME